MRKTRTEPYQVSITVAFFPAALNPWVTMIWRPWRAGASIEATLELWASSLRDVKARVRSLFTQEPWRRVWSRGALRLFPGWQRHGCLPEILPWIDVQSGKPRRGVVDREIIGPDRWAELVPVQRHGDGGAGPRARRVWRNRGRAASIAQIVDQDLALALGLGDGGDVALGAIRAHAVGQRLGERLNLLPFGGGL